MVVRTECLAFVRDIKYFPNVSKTQSIQTISKSPSIQSVRKILEQLQYADKDWVKLNWKNFFYFLNNALSCVIARRSSLINNLYGYLSNDKGLFCSVWPSLLAHTTAAPKLFGHPVSSAFMYMTSWRIEPMTFSVNRVTSARVAADALRARILSSPSPPSLIHPQCWGRLS